MLVGRQEGGEAVASPGHWGAYRSWGCKESDMTGGLNSNNSVCHSGSHDKLQESFGGLQAHREVAAHVLDVLLSCINRGIQSKGGEGHHLCVAGPPKADQAPGEEVTQSSSREGLMRGLDALFMEVWMKE